MIKYFIITGLISGLLAQPVSPQQLQGGISQAAIKSDIQADFIQSPVSQNNINLLDEHPSISVRIKDNRPPRSALGFHYILQTGFIDYVDPNSDLYESINVGDYFLAMDGVPANKALREHRNLGPEGTVIQCTFQTRQGVITLPCIRHDIRRFGPIWQQAYREGR